MGFEPAPLLVEWYCRLTHDDHPWFAFLTNRLQIAMELTEVADLEIMRLRRLDEI